MLSVEFIIYIPFIFIFTLQNSYPVYNFIGIMHLNPNVFGIYLVSQNKMHIILLF